MAYQGKDMRWYKTLEEREEANQRWEQTQLLKKQVQLQQEEARKQERYRRNQERTQWEQAREQAKEQERMHAEQMRVEEERNRELRRQNALLESERRKQVYEEEEDRLVERFKEMTEMYNQYVERDLEEKVYPLLREAGINDHDSFITGLRNIYCKPEAIGNREKYILEPINHYPKYLLLRPMHKLVLLDRVEENEQIHNALKECYYQLEKLLDYFPHETKDNDRVEEPRRKRGLFSAFRGSCVDSVDTWKGDVLTEQDKQAMNEMNAIISTFNSKISSIFALDRKKLDEYNQKISVFEERRINQFSPALELALENLSQIEMLYMREDAHDYRLQFNLYPPAYYDYKEKKITSSNPQSQVDDPNGLFQGLLNTKKDDDSVEFDKDMEYFLDAYFDTKKDYESLYGNDSEPEKVTNKDYLIAFDSDPLFDRAVYYAVQVVDIEMYDFTRYLSVGYAEGSEVLEKMVQRGIVTANSRFRFTCVI